MVRVRRRLAYTMLAAWVLLAQAGCLCFVHPISRPVKERIQLCNQVPRGCKNHLYVFFIHGLDPLDCADLAGVRDYVQSLGFIKTYYGQIYDTFWFAHEVRRLHKEDSLARFAVIGFDVGARPAAALARSVQSAKIPIDLLVYVSGTALSDTPPVRPENVARVLNIQGSELFGPVPHIQGAENLIYPDTGHYGAVTHLHTLAVLADELSEVALQVPVIEYVTASEEPRRPERLPRPRVLTAPPEEESDEWKFLEPETPRSPTGSRSPTTPPPVPGRPVKPGGGI